ncbi:MAG: hypothetical protein Q3965_02665 [Rothia sp. (in: high G+C Gram-positive bacteria)]|nr:hypothetical protein [Rothia sp. (in: high G+C Gram-positive bacteria)]
MREWLDTLHWSAAIGFFWVVGILRTSIVFSLGRLAATGGNRFSPIASLMTHPAYVRARHFINRWGVFAVPACFLTVGFQTAVILTTGFTQMPLPRWVPAMLLGTFIWGVIYGTVGMAVVWAWLENPIVTLALLVLGVAAIVLRRLSQRAKPLTHRK